MTTETMKSLSRDGVTLRYTDAGAGDPALVFIHGWTCNHTNWRPQIAHFAGSHRAVALDLRGHGESDKPDQDYTIAGFAGDVACLIDELGLQQPVLIGHSMGGAIALCLAREHPEILRAVVMIDSPIVPIPDALRPVADQVLSGLTTPSYAAVATGFGRTFFFNEASPPGLVEEVVAGIGRTPQRVMATALTDLLTFTSAGAGPIGVPSLFIRAATAYASEDDLRARYPGLEVHTVDCAHFVQMERPEETNALIEKFLEGLP